MEEVLNNMILLRHPFRFLHSCSTAMTKQTTELSNFIVEENKNLDQDLRRNVAALNAKLIILKKGKTYSKE